MKKWKGERGGAGVPVCLLAAITGRHLHASALRSRAQAIGKRERGRRTWAGWERGEEDWAKRERGREVGCGLVRERKEACEGQRGRREERRQSWERGGKKRKIERGREKACRVQVGTV
jgi:hypothetical protein